MRKEIRNSLMAIVAGFALLFFASCEEQAPPGLDLGDTRVADSSYLTSVENKQDKVILIEELTGVQCANCPKAAKNIKTMSDANPGRILAVGMHPPLGGGFTEPIPTKSQYDFRVEEADEVIAKLGGLSGGLPSGSINREPKTAGVIFDSDYPAWVGRVNPLLTETTPVNLNLEATYDAENNTGELVVKVALTENISDEIFLTAYVIEDDIEDYQDDAGDKKLYMHQHVFRSAITSVSGSSLNFADKVAGRVLQKRIGYEANISGVNAWNLDNCKIIAFVHKSGNDQSILHAAKVSFK
jgi:hypothetical protein